MRSDVTPVDVVVVGGGLAGLTAAAYLGRAGLSVRLVERAAELGGRGATRCQDGFYLNRGAHALYRSGEGTQVLAELGVPHHGHAVPAVGKALRAGRLYQLPTGALSLFTTGLLSLRAKGVAMKWLERTPKLSAQTLEHVSVHEWLVGAPPEVRALMEAFIRVATYSNAPEKFGAATALVQLQRALAGVLYVDGGWQTLVEGVAARARGFGVRITGGLRVERLERDGEGYVVALGDEERIPARGIVLAVPPREAKALLATAGARPLPALDHVVEGKVATLDLALERVPRPEDRFVLGIDQPLYLSVHSTIAKLAPEGKAVVHVMKYLPSGADDPDADRRELEALLDLAQPGWRKEVVHAQYLPRMTAFERLDLATEGGERGRPEPRVPGLPGVTLAGDWVQGGSWLADASFGSARAAAEALVLHLGPVRSEQMTRTLVEAQGKGTEAQAVA